MVPTRAEKTLASLHLRLVLPLSTIISFAAALVVYLCYDKNRILLSLAVLVLAFFHLFVWRLLLPRSERGRSQETVAFFVYGSAVLSTWVAVALGHETPLAGGFLIVLASTAFTKHLSYFVFWVVSLAGYLALAEFSGHDNFTKWQLVSITPWFALFGRLLFWKVATAFNEPRFGAQFASQQAEPSMKRAFENRLACVEQSEGFGLIVAGVAHDVKNSLQVICNFSELIQLGHEAKPIAAKIQNVVFNANATCKRMLVLAAKSEGHLLVHLDQLLDESVPQIQTLVPECIEISFVVETENSPVIQANLAEVRDGLVNLVKNSVEAIGSNAGKIEVRIAESAPDPHFESDWKTFGAALSARTIELQITDDGQGMDQETINSAFAPYFTTKESGHGFGLSSTLNSVCASGGEIKVASVKHSGTAIRLIFPLASDLNGSPNS